MPAFARPAVGPVQVLKVVHPGVEVAVGFHQVPPQSRGRRPASGGKSRARLRRAGSLRSPQKTEVRNSGIRTHGGHHQPHPHNVVPNVGIAPATVGRSGHRLDRRPTTRPAAPGGPELPDLLCHRPSGRGNVRTDSGTTPTHFRPYPARHRGCHPPGKNDPPAMSA